MRKKLTAAMLFLALAGFAAERPEAELRQIALEQLAKSMTRSNVRATGSIENSELGYTGSVTINAADGTGSIESSKLRCTVNTGGVIIYAAEGAGSVLLCKDDKFRPVLGYTSTVINTESELPCGMKWWLAEMNRQIQAMATADATSDGAKMEQTAEEGYTVVAPLIQTKWGQGSPYNIYAPEFNGSNAPAGCVATSLAQILNFNEWPKSAQFVGRYSTDGGKNYTEEEISTTYSYPYKTAYGNYSVDGSLTNIATITYNIVERKNIGWLLRDCGYANDMIYGADASGALAINTSLSATNCFSYPAEAIKYAYRLFYSDAEWHNIVYGELKKGYPIQYGGSDEDGGHAFVVHGIDADGLVAVNWGWNGVYDGYFAMDVMDSGSGTFRYYQYITYGFHPTPLSDDMKESLWAGDYSLTNGSGDEKILLQSEGIYNYTPYYFTGTLAIYFEDLTGGITGGIILIDEEEDAMQPFYGYSFRQQSIDEYIAEITEKGHTYKVYIASSTEEESEKGILRKARVEGGMKYYTMTVDSYGTPYITGTDFATTSINDISANTSAEQTGKTYSISGQQVNNDYRGIVIKNGKKIVKK